VQRIHHEPDHSDISTWEEPYQIVAREADGCGL